MEREFTEKEAARHNSLTEEGWNLTKGRLYLHGEGIVGHPGWWTRRKLRKAVRCFQQALEINTDGWSSMWALGKIYQRLGEHEMSLHWFSQAQKVNPAQPDVAREAGLAALDCGDSSLAVQLCRSAVDNNPNDIGLISNLALAYMLHGNDPDAVACASRAVSLDSADEVSRNVLKCVQDVLDGRKTRPRRLLDAFPN
jgi:Flp pilus assembly protein TadD